MQKLLTTLAMAVLVVTAFWCVTQLRVVYVQQFCAGIKEWRITFRSPDRHSLDLLSGFYMASCYTLTNGFGLREVGRIPIIVPREGTK
jgi:hypothetical protein